MNHPTPSSREADPVLLLIAVIWLAVESAAVLIVALIALALALAGRQPSAPAACPPEAPAVCPAPTPLPVVITPAPEALPPVPVPAAPLERLTVADLRRLARVAGLPAALSRSALLAALA